MEKRSKSYTIATSKWHDRVEESLPLAGAKERQQCLWKTEDGNSHFFFSYIKFEVL